jgi:hypothetical protein
VFWKADDVRELYAGIGKFWENLARFEKSTLLAVFGQFCMGVLWRGFGRKMPIFGPWSGILAGCSARRSNFLESNKLIITDYVLVGRLASWRVRRI